MDKNELIKLLNESPPTIATSKVLGWVNILPKETFVIKPTDFREGDVVMNMGLRHPVIVFKKTGKDFVCGLLTTEPTCDNILEPTQSRFFPASFFTKVILQQKDMRGQYMGCYENKKHLREVHKKLKNIFA